MSAMPYQELESNFNAVETYEFAFGLAYGWRFGTVSIGEDTMPCIKVEGYKSSSFTQSYLDNFQNRHGDVDGVQIILPDIESSSKDIYIIGDLPSFMRSLNSDFTNAGLKKTFVNSSISLGYSEQDVASVLSEEEVFVYNLFTLNSDNDSPVSPGDGMR